MPVPRRVGRAFASASIVSSAPTTSRSAARCGSVSVSSVVPNLLVSQALPLQTIDGFGAAINAHSWDSGAAAAAIDYLDDMGVRTWRVVYDMMDWESTNDDADPANFNWTAFNSIFTSAAYEELWSTISYLNGKGYGSNIILNFMGRLPSWLGGATMNTSLKDEVVETVVAAAYYGLVTRGLSFGQFEPFNETDWDGYEGPQIGSTDYADVMNRVAVRLNALGSPLSDLKLVGPDTAMSSVAMSDYMPDMMSYPTLMAKVDHFTIHQYAANAAGLMTSIAGSSYPTKHGWVSETDNWANAWAQITEGVNNVILWEGYDSVYVHGTLAGRGSSAPNDSGQNFGLANAPLAYSTAGGGTYTRRGEYYFWQQLYKYVDAGAVRVTATSSSSGVSVLAFKHAASNRLTVVVRNDNGGSRTLTIGGLSGYGAFSVHTTNQDNSFAPLSDVVPSGGVVTVTVPYNSLTTLTATS